jgi:hypothetical protein
MKLLHRLLGQAPRPSVTKEPTEVDAQHDRAITEAQKRITARDREIRMLRQELHEELELSSLEDRFDNGPH